MDRARKILASNIAIVFAAAIAVMLLTNELQRRFDFTEAQFYSIALIVDIVAIAVVLKINPWRPKIEKPARFLSSLFFTFGAFSVGLLFSRYWMEWTNGFNSNEAILGPAREFVPVSVSSLSLMINAFRRVIITPFVEEIVCRLGMLGVLSRFMPKGFALLISSVVFALGHVYGYGWVEIMPIFVFGLMMGVTYLTVGLGFSILLHSMVNVWSYVTENLYQFDAFLIGLMIVLFIGLIVFSVQVFRLRKMVFGG